VTGQTAIDALRRVTVECVSIVVDLDRLGSALADRSYGYLLTTSGDTVKAVTVTASVVDGDVDIPVGSSGSARNLSENPAATLLFPPADAGGYSLIVDGTARATDHGFRLTPARAVLHRPADHAAGPTHAHDSACGHDCQPV
jgi:hypothetical protein